MKEPKKALSLWLLIVYNIFNVYISKNYGFFIFIATAMKNIIDRDWKITRDRGKWIERKGYSMIATFHPAALFRDESKKQLFWKDLKNIRQKYDELLNKTN